MDATRHLQMYRNTQLATVDPGTLLLMLYQGAVSFLQQAKDSLESGNVEVKGIYITKTLAIISELLASLNFEVGGEVARNLESLYLYMIDRITAANLGNDTKLLEENIYLLSTLREGWEGAVAEVRRSAAQESYGHGSSARA